MAIAALDLGRRRIGIAIADDAGIAVHPIGALERRSVARDLESIRARLVEFEVSHVVVGLPLNMDGSAGPSARAAVAFADRLREASGLAIDLFDERLTSFEAEERLKELSGRRARDKGTVDAVAASIILEGWLNHRRSGGSGG
jgi:putative holliday junction resolvase